VQKLFFKYFPLLGFSLIWGLALYLHNLGLYNLRPISGEAKFIVYSTLFTFFGTYIAAGLYSRNFDQFYEAPAKIEINSRLLAKIVIGFSLFSFLGAFLNAYSIGQQLGGMSIYIERPLMVRQEVVALLRNETDVPFIFRIGSYLKNIGFVSTLLGGILFSRQQKIRYIGLFPIFALLISQVVTLGRYNFVNGIGFFFIAFVLTSFFYPPSLRKKKIRNIFVSSITLLTVVIILSYYTLKWRAPKADDIIALLQSSFYYYFVGGITAFDINHQIHDFKASFGEYSFRSIYGWLAKVGLHDPENVKSVFNPFVKISPTYVVNTKTFMNPLYQDFKIFGVILFTSFWAFITNFYSLKFYRSPSLLTLFISALLTFSLLISFFSFYFQSITLIIFWGIIIFIINYIWGDRLFKVHTN